MDIVENTSSGVLLETAVVMPKEDDKSLIFVTI